MAQVSTDHTRGQISPSLKRFMAMGHRGRVLAADLPDRHARHVAIAVLACVQSFDDDVLEGLAQFLRVAKYSPNFARTALGLGFGRE